MRRETTVAAGLAATLVRPDDPNGITLYCLPGGGMSRGYFDIPAEGYSMAAHLAAQGFTSVLLDHPGVGDTPAPDDPWALTPHLVAAADAAAVAELHDRLGGIAIGVGHSMGAMLTVVLQARHRPYAGVALLGYSQVNDVAATAIGAQLSAAELAVLGDPARTSQELVALARQRYSRPLPRGTTCRSPFLLGGMAVPEPALQAMDTCASHLLAVCGLGAMLKCSAPELAALDVPAFLGFGEHDITGPARDTAGAMPSCPDITLFELAGAGHNANVAPNRTDLWDRVSAWARSTAVTRRM